MLNMEGNPMSTSAEQTGRDRTLQFISQLQQAGLMEPAERWELKREEAEKHIDAEILGFVKDRLPRLLCVMFTMRNDSPIATQLSFVANMADIIYQSWVGTYNEDGKARLCAYPFAKQHSITTLCVALAIYAKMLGVEQKLLVEEQAENDVWQVRCTITNTGEWKHIVEGSLLLIPPKPAKTPT